MTETFWSFDPAWWRVAVAVAALVAGAWLAREHARRAGGRAMAALEALRVVILLLLALTLLKPERVRRIRREERMRVAVLCDASGSMATRDVAAGGGAAVTRAEWLAAERARKFWTPLETAYDVVVGDVCAPPADAAADADPGTDLNAALEGVAKAGGSVRAALLISDGDWNAGAPPVAAATRLRMRGVPVWTVVAGSDRFLPDLELASVAAPAYGLVEETIAIPFTVQSRLPREVRTEAVLERDGRVVARKPLVIPAMALVQESIAFDPDTEGEARLAVRIPVEGDETQPANNAREFRMALRREVLHVLVIDTLPRWEYRYLRNALARDPGADVRCLLLHPSLGPGGGRDYLPAFPATRQELSSFDVVFLGDVGVKPGQLTEDQAAQIRGLVEQQGSGLVFLPGRMGHQASLPASPLGDLMPVALDAVAPEGFGSAIESRPVLTTRGREHLLTLLAATPEQNEALWRGLPGFHWYAPVLRARPGGDVLAVHAEARNEHGRIPLLVTREAGNGKVLFMGTDSAWRWRRGVEDTYHYRFWGQVARWMAHRRHLAHAEGIRFFFSPESPAAGDRVAIHATAFDGVGLPLEQGTVGARIVAPGGGETAITLAPEPGGWGTFRGMFVARDGGPHKVAVRCAETGREVEATLDVARTVRERVGRPARSDVLREIASITGGRCVTAAGLASVLEQIRILPEPEPVEERFRLWCSAAWGAGIVGLLALYWCGRKLAGKI